MIHLCDQASFISLLISSSSGLQQPNCPCSSNSIAVSTDTSTLFITLNKKDPSSSSWWRVDLVDRVVRFLGDLVARFLGDGERFRVHDLVVRVLGPGLGEGVLRLAAVTVEWIS